MLWVRWNDMCVNVSVAGGEVHMRPVFETECLHKVVTWDGT